MESSRKGERGQALIIVVMAMVGLLAAVGLAIDGGTALLERRRMQNAADAAALAGTRELAKAICDDSGANLDDEVYDAVREFAFRNGVRDEPNNVVADYVDVDEISLERVGNGAIPVGSMGISVTVKIERRTFFVTLIGIDRGGAAAHALALTDAPEMANAPIRPFGIPEDLLLNYQAGDEFWIGFKNCNSGNTTACYIKEDPNDPDEDAIAQHRGWMNLGYMWNIDEASDFPRAEEKGASTSGCAASTPGLKCWMQRGKTLDLFKGDYIHAYPGTNSSAIDEAPLFANTGETILLPVYDSVPAYEDIPGPKPDEATQGGGYYYHIVGLAAVHVQYAHQGHGHIQVSLENYIHNSGKLNPTVGAGYKQSKACQTGVQLVTLWR